MSNYLNFTIMEELNAKAVVTAENGVNKEEEMLQSFLKDNFDLLSLEGAKTLKCVRLKSDDGKFVGSDKSYRKAFYSVHGDLAILMDYAKWMKEIGIKHGVHIVDGNYVPVFTLTVTDKMISDGFRFPNEMEIYYDSNKNNWFKSLSQREIRDRVRKLQTNRRSLV